MREYDLLIMIHAIVYYGYTISSEERHVIYSRIDTDASLALFYHFDMCSKFCMIVSCT